MVGFAARVGVGLTAAALAVAVPIGAGAQGRHVVGGGRVAGIAPPPPVVVVQPGISQVGFDQFSSATIGAVPDVGSVPVVVLPDGRVFADFGFGFQQVVRTCSSTVVVQPNAVGQPGLLQPIVTQPAPAQATASEQMLAATRPGGTLQPARGSDLNPCWSSQAGMVYVFRR